MGFQLRLTSIIALITRSARGHREAAAGFQFRGQLQQATLESTAESWQKKASRHFVHVEKVLVRALQTRAGSS